MTMAWGISIIQLYMTPDCKQLFGGY